MNFFYGTAEFFRDSKVGSVVKVGHNDKYNDILEYVRRIKKHPGNTWLFE